VPINGSFMKYEGKPCNCDKELVNITLTGCVKEMCREKDCPKEPLPKDKCHRVVPQKEPCKCATYLQTPFHVSSPIKSSCGNDFCSKFEEVDDECKETCVEYEVEGECDENCYERKEIRNKATCTKQVTCEDLGPDKIAIKTDTCVFGLSTGRYHGNCGVCDKDSYAKLVPTVCVAIITSIIAKSAIPKTHPATKNGAKRELRQTIVNPTKKLRLVRMI